MAPRDSHTPRGTHGVAHLDGVPYAPGTPCEASRSAVPACRHTGPLCGLWWLAALGRCRRVALHYLLADAADGDNAPGGAAVSGFMQTPQGQGVVDMRGIIWDEVRRVRLVKPTRPDVIA